MRPIEAFSMAIAAIRAHKLRSLLTLVGIVAGVASIIAVMTGISVVQAAMEKEMSVLGSRVFQVQKWPAGGMPRYHLSGRIATNVQAQSGKALCIWGDAGWGGLVRQGKYWDRQHESLGRALSLHGPPGRGRGSPPVPGHG